MKQEAPKRRLLALARNSRARALVRLARRRPRVIDVVAASRRRRFVARLDETIPTLEIDLVEHVAHAARIHPCAQSP
jgi:hypothetical protein